MRKITAIAALGAMSTAPIAASATATTLVGNLALAATVSAGCTSIAQSTAFAFPSPLVQATQPVVSGAITTVCAATVPANITFDYGLHSSGGYPNLSTNTTTQTLIAYGLFQSTTPTVSAGTITGTSITLGASGGISISGAALGAPLVTKIWAVLVSAVPADIASGTYSDTIGVTLSF